MQNLLWYVKKGVRDARSALRKGIGFYFKYCLYVLASLFGKSFFLTHPLFAFADLKIVKEIEETGSFRIENAFSDADSKKKYRTGVLVYFLRLAFLAAVSFIFLVPAFLLAYVGLGFDTTNPDSGGTAVAAVILLVLGSIGALVFSALILIYFAPAIYLLREDENLGISDILKQCNSAMKQGTMKLFGIFLLNFLFYLAALLLVFFLTVICKIIAELISAPIFLYLCFVILVLSLVLLFPAIYLSFNVASVSLIKDAVEVTKKQGATVAGGN